jgi:Niemann-Pick C1 protein
MDFIGGGAKNTSGFLDYLGAERPGLGSPFQINFPDDPDTGFDRKPLNCYDQDINSKCVCADCPEVCPTLPYIAPPSTSKCHVGAVSCLTFSLLIVYSVALLLGILYYTWRQALQQRRKRYERLALVDPPMSPSLNGGGNGLDGLVGRGEDAESGPSGSIHFRLGRGASLLDPMDHVQPKQNRINAVLRRFFYRLGLTCAKRPLETFALTAVIVAVLNIGWKFFAIETDPVKLWVAPNSESALQKQFFDDTFGPFYRVEQAFVTKSDGGNVIEYDTLNWWLGVEADIGELQSKDGITLQDICFSPAGEGTPCVVQSVSAWLGDNLEQWGDDWKERVSDCSARPVECLPPFGQPIDSKLVLGGTGGKPMEARALVITWVVNNYNDERVKPAEEWERTLREYFGNLHKDGVNVAYSTGISLEEEINKSTNTDVKIVVLSYLVMFLYVSLTLGGGLPPSLLSAIASRVYRTFYQVFAIVHLAKYLPTPSDRSTTPVLSLVPTLLSVNSKFSLGLFGILIVLVAVSSSIGLFSLVGVRITLIIAEVIPFLVLAVGVDNVFILVHELERQNALHAHDGEPPQGGDDEDDDIPQIGGPSLSPEERVARAVARMGPSIALSAITETGAFALGAFVPMPAVRNFAIYAAGSVFLGACMQVTVFVSAMAVDLRRAEVSPGLG